MIRDGIVEGTSGDDLIDTTYTGDPEGDMVDNSDAILPGEGPNDDIIYGYDGDDEIHAGLGDDDVYGGEGDDDVYGGAGDDTIYGGDGSDTVYGGEGDDVIDTSGSNPMSDYGWGPVPQDTDMHDDRDTVHGGAGDDTITTGDDKDTILGQAGDDTIDGGLDDDTIDGGAGDDNIIGGHGSDAIDGGEGDDVIWGGIGDPNDPLNIPDDSDPRPDNGIDVIHGGLGNDTIYGEDDADKLFGDEGNDTIYGGVDNDTIRGDEGVDKLYGEHGNDTIDGGAGNDIIDGGIGNDTIDGGADDDTIDGGDGNDWLHGSIGNDTITAGDGTDEVIGGDGNDTIYGGGDNDVLSGNAGRDTFYIREEPGSGPENTTVHGGSAGQDWDTLNLSEMTSNGWNITNHVQNPDSDGNGFDGQVQLVHSTTGETANINYTNIEEVVPCFTPGTLIATPTGERRVEDLRPGDRVITRDNGIQPIAWAGGRAMGCKELAQGPHLRPILIRAGALGNNLPAQDLLVSPNHRVLVANERTALYFDEREVLASAKHLVDNKGIVQVDPTEVTYLHFMCERHEVVLSNGAWTETFQPGDYSLQGVGDEQRQELFELFPELRNREGLEDYTAARMTLKKHEARMLVAS
ncbi:MAG: type I secretion protein [Rhodobacterales bacterium]|nr:MAG: type I secretion protein [Rhodobacterales bacterium]